MAPMTSISNSINNYLIVIFTIYTINNVQSQRVYCGGAPGTTCSCPPSSNPAVIPGSTCILDCGQIDSCNGQTLECRAGDPCEISCSGKASCRDAATVNGYSATDVKVTCLRDDACSNQMFIHCGTGDCLLGCEHWQSCQDWQQEGAVSTSRARSFQCYGPACPHFQLPFQFSPSPTPAPTTIPTISPTKSPTSPTQNPTPAPTSNPSSSPTKRPTMSPTNHPTNVPTSSPTFRPTRNPTKKPTKRPTTSPTPSPTNDPTRDPTVDPTSDPTMDPTKDPTSDPTQDPTMYPTEPTDAPSEAPTAYEAAQAAEFLNSTGWTALISALTLAVFCFIVIVVAIICCKKYHAKDTIQTEMAGIAKASIDTQHNITPETVSSGDTDTDMQVLHGMGTTGKLSSIAEVNLRMLHSLNAYNKQDESTNAGKSGEDKFEIDPNLVGAFMFGDTGVFGEDKQEDVGNNSYDNYDNYNGNFVNPFGDNEEPNQLEQADSIDDMGSLQQRVKLMRLLQQQYEYNSYDNYDNYNGNFVNNPFGDNEEPNQLEQADSIDDMGSFQQRVKLMRLLQQQYELMHDYNMNPIQHDDDEPQQGDHHVDVGYL
eukprot:CAMPEP_0201592400 /NCGR_PEP_ID=MMETSP0190_2-20130828/190309_1 /ASSEMBLY_ACC=CAM_ASM_000263 /TAXON_ID=37353 /ORGANISM="Rosalina sp." /LENGTH=594 /DNA_ID=CAMNT_0048051163 /DNA_START=24 /DNA_END=1808 /DNA_ORIENTATION=+